MLPFLWDKFTLDEVNEKTRYWVDLWESMIDNLTSQNLGFVLDLMNPHLLVRHIIDEIVFNDFQNPDIRAFFKQQLEFFSEHDPATKKLFSADFALIRREFGETRVAYLLQLCRTVDQAYSNALYLDELYSALRDVLSIDEWQEGDADRIRMISQCMIVEFLLSGRSLASVKDLPTNIFDTSYGLHLVHDFPAGVTEDEFIHSGTIDYPAYRAAIQAKVDAVTVDQRVDFFRSYFSPKPTTFYLLYQVEGLKGEDLDVTIGNVNLYSPKKKRYIRTPSNTMSEDDRNEELFGGSEDQCFANAAVRVDEFDTAASEQEAVAAIEKALDFFRCFVYCLLRRNRG